jgi:hypothetical protein
MKKTHLSKRALSILMALLMVITSVPLFALPASAEPTSTLFHYTFDSTNLDSINSSSNYAIAKTSGDGNGSGSTTSNSDNLSFSNTWVKGSVNGNIRHQNYKRNWKIALDFYYTSRDSYYGNDEWNYVLAVYGSTVYGDSFSNKPLGLTYKRQSWYRRRYVTKRFLGLQIPFELDGSSL